MLTLCVSRKSVLLSVVTSIERALCLYISVYKYHRHCISAIQLANQPINQQANTHTSQYAAILFKAMQTIPMRQKIRWQARIGRNKNQRNENKN